nr:glutamate receptor 2.8-like isoform X1 [Ipomoea batatas]
MIPPARARSSRNSTSTWFPGFSTRTQLAGDFFEFFFSLLFASYLESARFSGRAWRWKPSSIKIGVVLDLNSPTGAAINSSISMAQRLTGTAQTQRVGGGYARALSMPEKVLHALSLHAYKFNVDVKPWLGLKPFKIL